MFSLAELEAAAATVYRALAPTPQINWPLLSERAGFDVWVKHENHTPLGAFKVRGGLVYFDWLTRTQPAVRGVVTATRGNHGQSIAFAARRYGLTATILVPQGNSPEKNAAMLAHGAQLVEYGHDFQAANEHADVLAQREGLHRLASFHPLLVQGVASYALEFFRALPDLHTVYVPIGMGSGICGVMAVRDALGLATDVVGVVAAGAPAYARSFAAGVPVATERADTFADGLACRTPDARAVEAIHRGAARVVEVSEAQIADAMRIYFTDTHNLAEGGGAAPLAALLAERDRMRGRRVGLVLSGGNVDLAVYRQVLAGQLQS